MAMITPIGASFKFTDFIMNLVAKDLSNDHARQRARGGKGASISWIIGHLIDYRLQVMNLLSAGNEGGYKDFGTKSATDGHDYPSIAELLAKWNQTSSELGSVLDNIRDEQLTARIEDSSSPHHEKTVMEALIFCMWHESYHMGALGMIRTELGYPATAQLAIAAAKVGKTS